MAESQNSQLLRHGARATATVVSTSKWPLVTRLLGLPHVAGTLPVVLRQQAAFINYGGAAARKTLQRAKLLSSEIDVLAPSVTRDGRRPDNCEYPWEDAGAELHAPLDWTFTPSELLLEHAGRTALKLILGAIERLVE
jgi:hypothetical protein